MSRYMRNKTSRKLETLILGISEIGVVLTWFYLSAGSSKIYIKAKRSIGSIQLIFDIQK